MIYLDYGATTPVSKELLELYIDTCNNYIGNVNSLHALGKKSKRKLEQVTSDVARQFNCYNKEIIFTSGASESNTMAIMGSVNSLKSIGNHIITSKLEHKSILELMDKLSKKEYLVDYVNILPNGQIDLIDLENKIRDNTILISICGVNSEIGFIQPLDKIREIIDKKNQKIFFHSDLTQALGKIKIDLNILDLASFSSHKIYAPIGCGILYKKRTIQIEKIIHGTTSSCPYRGGTPPLPLIVTFAKAIEKAQDNLLKNHERCMQLKKILIKELSKYPIKINSNDMCIPQIFNFSLLNLSNKLLVDELSKEEIFLSTSSACCNDLEESELLNIITNNNKSISKTSIRLSLSHITTEEEIYTFLKNFNNIWNKYNKKNN